MPVLQLNLYLREVWGEGGKEECESGCFQGSHATFFLLEVFISPTLLELAREPGGSGFSEI